MTLDELIKEIQNRLWAEGGGEVVITHNSSTVKLEEELTNREREENEY
tara:strand:+ start:64993 stop:65136 length:144 start_codon:yes stop_codon:yes gene_type:complete